MNKNTTYWHHYSTIWKLTVDFVEEKYESLRNILLWLYKLPKEQFSKDMQVIYDITFLWFASHLWHYFFAVCELSMALHLYDKWAT